MKAILIVLALCVPALAEEVETDYSWRIFDDRGRETDVTELRDRTDESQPLNVIQNGLSTQTKIPPGGSATVITGPGTPNGQPLGIRLTGVEDGVDEDAAYDKFGRREGFPFPTASVPSLLNESPQNQILQKGISLGHDPQRRLRPRERATGQRTGQSMTVEAGRSAANGCPKKVQE